MLATWFLLLVGMSCKSVSADTPFSQMQPYLVGIGVADVDRSADWYEGKLGFKVFRRMDLPDHGLRIVFLKAGSFRLELIEKKGSRPLRQYAPDLQDEMLVQGLKKVAFLVPDVASAAAYLKAQGIPFTVEPFEDKDMGLRSFLVADPDGNLVQVMQELQ